MYTKSVIRRPYQLALRAVQNPFHGIDQFAPVRKGAGGGGGGGRGCYKSRAL